VQHDEAGNSDARSAGPSDRFTPPDIARMKMVLRPVAMQLTRALGGVWPGGEAGWRDYSVFERSGYRFSSRKRVKSKS